MGYGTTWGILHSLSKIFTSLRGFLLMESTIRMGGNIRKAGIIVQQSLPNAGRIFNSSSSLYLFQIADNLIILIDDTTILRCAGVLCKDLHVWNTQNISKPQLKVIKSQIQILKSVRMFARTYQNLCLLSVHTEPHSSPTWHRSLQKLGKKPCLTALVPSVHGNYQLYLQENILQISCSPATRNASSGDKAGRKHWAFLI